jgi:hypothetical protein
MSNRVDRCVEFILESETVDRRACQYQRLLVRTISVHNAFIDCYKAVDFRRNLLLDSTASIAVDFKVSNGVVSILIY